MINGTRLDKRLGLVEKPSFDDDKPLLLTPPRGGVSGCQILDDGREELAKRLQGRPFELLGRVTCGAALRLSPDLDRVNHTMGDAWKSLLAFFIQYVAFFKAVASVAAAFIAVIKLAPQMLSAWRTFQDRRYIVEHLGAQKYTAEQIRFATTNYIEPDCQNVDPAGTEDWRRVYPLRNKAFDTLNKLLTAQAEYRHTIILADSGMGKTSLLLNYYAMHSRKLWSAFKLAVVPLGAPDANALIQAIPDKPATVLFLDAFDEDAQAIHDHKKRLGELLALTIDFRHILITCRTQFFLHDDEIPRDVVGVVRFGPTNQSKQYTFYKFYLSPFSNSQVSSYLHKRYPFWRRKERNRAATLAANIGDLTARPMLLANIDDILRSGRELKFAFEIYDEMVRRWIQRERPIISSEDALWQFSEITAADIFSKRQERGGEIIPNEAIEPIARSNGILLERWQLTGRSLLNRTADGQYKFAHRSILEYLLVRAFVAGRVSIYKAWTDQMRDFFWQMVVRYYANPETRVALECVERADLSGMSFLSWSSRNDFPLVPVKSIFASLTAEPSQLTTKGDIRSIFVEGEPVSKTESFVRGLDINTDKLVHRSAWHWATDYGNQLAIGVKDLGEALLPGALIEVANLVANLPQVKSPRVRPDFFVAFRGGLALLVPGHGADRIMSVRSSKAILVFSIPLLVAVRIEDWSDFPSAAESSADVFANLQFIAPRRLWYTLRYIAHLASHIMKPGEELTWDPRDIKNSIITVEVQAL
jgi:hypothetical protein